MNYLCKQMNDSIVNIIHLKIKNSKNGKLFFNNSFPEFDDEYVGQILSDLANKKVIHRLSRGVYLKTKETRYGLVYPPVEKIAKAIAKRDKANIVATGETALYILGLTTQVPMNAVFLTSGSKRDIRIGERTITFKNATPKTFLIRGMQTSMIVQAMKAIGEKNMSDEYVPRISSLILQQAERDTISNDLKAMPVWIRRIFVKTLKKGERYTFYPKNDLNV